MEGLVDAEQLAACSDDDLTRSVAQLAGLVAATQAQLLAVLAELDRRASWRDDGARDLASWVTAVIRVAPTTARTLADAARTLDDTPALAALLADGTLSFDQFDAARRWALGPTSVVTDLEVAAVAPGMSVAQLRRRARRARPAGAGPARLHWHRSSDGSRVELHAHLDAVSGARVVRQLEAAAERMPAEGPGGERRSQAERCADALVELVLGHGAGDRVADERPGDGRAHEDPPSVDHPAADHPADDRPVPVVVDPGADVMVHLTLEADGALTGEVELGGVVSGPAAERLLCGARWQVVAHEPSGRVVGVGRSSRTPPRWLRHLLAERDGGCRFPGCAHTRWLHAHHIRHWIDGGETEIDNLVLVCSAHHTFLHEHGWQVRGSPDHRLRWIRGDGTEYRPPATTVLDEARRRILRLAWAA